MFLKLKKKVLRALSFLSILFIRKFSHSRWLWDYGAVKRCTLCTKIPKRVETKREQKCRLSKTLLCCNALFCQNTFLRAKIATITRPWPLPTCQLRLSFICGQPTFGTKYFTEVSNYNSTEDIAVRNVFVHGTISRDSIKNKWQNQILIPRCRYLHFWRLHFFTFFEARPCPPKSHCQTNTARIVTTWQSCDKVTAWQACFQLLALAIVFH